MNGLIGTTGANIGAPQYTTNTFAQGPGLNHTANFANYGHNTMGANFGNPMMTMPQTGTTYATLPQNMGAYTTMPQTFVQQPTTMPVTFMQQPATVPVNMATYTTQTKLTQDIDR